MKFIKFVIGSMWFAYEIPDTQKAFLNRLSETNPIRFSS